MANRDEFTPQTRDILARRVNYICSNPSCRVLTSGPHSLPDKYVNVGVAAHICAAAPGGTRYDLSMTPELRSDIQNGIWLCQTCAHLIDTDENEYTVEILKKWKQDHENSITEGLQHSAQLIQEIAEILRKLEIPASDITQINDSSAITASHLPNRDTLFRAIALVQQTAIEVINRQDELDRMNEQSPYLVPTEQVGARNQSLVNYRNSMNALTTEKLVAGKAFEQTISDLIVFIEAQVFLKVEKPKIISGGTPPRSFTALELIGRIAGKVIETTEKIDQMNNQASL